MAPRLRPDIDQVHVARDITRLAPQPPGADVGRPLRRRRSGDAVRTPSLFRVPWSLRDVPVGLPSREHFYLYLPVPEKSNYPVLAAKNPVLLFEYSKFKLEL
jgi:hypothetical protein